MEYRNASRARRQRRAAQRRRAARNRLLLVGSVAAVFLLTGAGRAIGGLTSSPVDTQPPFLTISTAPPTPIPTPAAAPAASDGWRLALVNPWNHLPDHSDITLAKLKNGLSVDSRCYPALQRMLDGCRAAGLSPVVCSAYRSTEAQTRLFERKSAALAATGLGPEAARAEAGKAVAVPGTSEHQLGLAVDIVDRDNQNLDKSQEETAVQKWLVENCWKYGFILRYPDGKSGLTGIIYEPWHYRYVGEDAAKEITDSGLCLEEYLTQRGGGA